MCLCFLLIFPTYTDNDIEFKLPSCALRWLHNELVGVSNHRRLDCLLNRLFRRITKEAPKLRITGLCEGNQRWPVDSPHKGPMTRRWSSVRLGPTSHTALPVREHEPPTTKEWWIADLPTSQGLYSLNVETSYRKISWSLEAARFGFGLFQLLWNLTGISAAALPRCLSNFRAIRSI